MPLPVEATYSYTVAATEFGCSDSVSPKKRCSRKVLVFEEAPDAEPFVIDEDDYLVIREIYYDANTECTLDELRCYVKTRTRDEEEEGRVYKIINHSHHCFTIPPSIGQLECLEYLESRYYIIESIPPSIGRLQNLKELRLHCNNDLPEEIGELANLKKLVMGVESITSPASSIGRLQNLRELQLFLRGRPKHIPEEIGDLINLKRLDLIYAGITCLPSFIGRLQNLKVLRLCYTTGLVNLPKEIGDLNNLRVLCLFNTGIRTLPHSILGKLKRLQHLNLDRACIPQLSKKEDLIKFLLTAVQECPVLGYIGDMLIESIEGADQVCIDYKLACNRARWRLWIAGGLEETPKLWPLVLQNAKRAFEEYTRNDLKNGNFVDNQDQEEEEEEASIFCNIGPIAPSPPPAYFRGTRNHPYVIPMADAVYRLIVGVDPGGRESFIKVLMNRNENNVSTEI